MKKFVFAAIAAIVMVSVSNVLLLFFCQQFSGWYMMPFEEATTATAACGMLGNKYRMPSHWCLLTVIPKIIIIVTLSLL